jgi:hypothetical protein
MLVTRHCIPPYTYLTHRLTYLAPVARFVRLLGLFEASGPFIKARFSQYQGLLGPPPEVWCAEPQGCKVRAQRPPPRTDAPLASGFPGVTGPQVR